MMGKLNSPTSGNGQRLKNYNFYVVMIRGSLFVFNNTARIYLGADGYPRIYLEEVGKKEIGLLIKEDDKEIARKLFLLKVDPDFEVELAWDLARKKAHAVSEKLHQNNFPY